MPASLSAASALAPPFLGRGFALRLGGLLAGLALGTAAILTAGPWWGETLALAGHTASSETYDLFIGQDHLRLPANVMRFAEQRATGTAERVDLYATWPEMLGYSDDRRDRFNDVRRPDQLIFLQISQSTMSRDMSGRVAPIYRFLFEGPATKGPAGLTAHRLRENSGYGHETLFTGEDGRADGYAVRCIIPADPSLSTAADCQRDVHAGKDLVVVYRFSSQLLPQWRAIDDHVARFVDQTLIP